MSRCDVIEVNNHAYVDIDKVEKLIEEKEHSVYATKFYSMQKQIDEKDKEIERLNNIINELEKDIKNLYTYGIKNNAEQRDYLLNRLEELQKLKGSDKE